MRKFIASFLTTAFLISASATSAGAVSDHLQCFKIKDDSAKQEYTADITPSDLGLAIAAGCTIKVPAKQLCVDVTKENVSPIPPETGDGIDAQQYLCYKAKCPKDQRTASVTDQFGNHPISIKKTLTVCAPLLVLTTCSDVTQNGDETDVDCGGSCPTCVNGSGCVVSGDCTSGLCSGGVCQSPAPTCSDVTQNGDETDVDCGGSCPTCVDGSGCLVSGDCTSGLCSGDICQSL